MIIHIPHASRKLNGCVEIINEKKNLDFLTDVFVDELFEGRTDVTIRFVWSRFVCDVERFRENDPMEKKGQGVIYVRDVFGNPIKRNISDEEVYRLYDEHHKYLTREVNFGTANFDNVIIVDAHSYEPLNDDDPDICLGSDEFHTPEEMVNQLQEHFIENDFTVGINHPFSGTLVPKLHYRKSRNVLSIMIEVNKKTCRKDFLSMKTAIHKCLDIINTYECYSKRNIPGDQS